MAACPQLDLEEEPAVEDKVLQPSLLKLVNEKPPVRGLLEEIFAGHEEFLGFTPD